MTNDTTTHTYESTLVGSRWYIVASLPHYGESKPLDKKARKNVYIFRLASLLGNGRQQVFLVRSQETAHTMFVVPDDNFACFVLLWRWQMADDDSA